MTDIEQLEKDLKWLERQKQDGHCGEGTFERHQRYDHNERIDRIVKAALAHMEAMKQEPAGYLVCDPMIARKPVKAVSAFPGTREWLYPASRKDDAKYVSLIVRGKLKALYTPHRQQNSLF